MVNVALAFAVLDVTGSVTDVGFVFAAFTLPLVGFLLVGGVFADRFQQRGVMVSSDLVCFASQGLAAALLVSGHARLWSSSSSRPSAGLRGRSSCLPRRL